MSAHRKASLQTNNNSWYLYPPPIDSIVSHSHAYQDVHPEPVDPHEQLSDYDPSRPFTTERTLFTPPGTIIGDHPIPIDPTLLADELPLAPAGTLIPDVNGSDVEEDPDGDSDRLGSKRGQRLTVAEKAATYGLVEGVMRGNMVYSALLALCWETRLMLDRGSSAE
jgi:hypothetical protein